MLFLVSPAHFEILPLLDARAAQNYLAASSRKRKR